VGPSDTTHSSEPSPHKVISTCTIKPFPIVTSNPAGLLSSWLHVPSVKKEQSQPKVWLLPLRQSYALPPCHQIHTLPVTTNNPQASWPQHRSWMCLDCPTNNPSRSIIRTVVMSTIATSPELASTARAPVAAPTCGCSVALTAPVCTAPAFPPPPPPPKAS
jgi:hypothetical protein